MAANEDLNKRIQELFIRAKREDEDTVALAAAVEALMQVVIRVKSSDIGEAGESDALIEITAIVANILRDALRGEL